MAYERLDTSESKWDSKSFIQRVSALDIKYGCHAQITTVRALTKNKRKLIVKNCWITQAKRWCYRTCQIGRIRQHLIDKLQIYNRWSK